LFIALAGAYAKDADSIFGHTFLVHAPTDIVGTALMPSETVADTINGVPTTGSVGTAFMPSETVADTINGVPTTGSVGTALMPSLLLWTAVNFAADTRDVKWYELYPKGISGGLNAYYFTLPLFQKIEEYKGSQTRDIRFFPIKCSEAEYERFLQNLAIVRKEPIPYKFFTYNCADGTYQLLFDSLDDLPKPSQVVMSPLDVITMLDAEHRLGEPFILPSLVERLQNATDTDHAELEFMEWENKQNNTDYDDDRRQKMAQLRHSISQKRVNRPEVFVKDKKWSTPHGYSRLDIGGSYADDDYVMNIGFRPLLHDQTDNPHFYSGTSTLELLSTSVSVQKDSLTLQNIDYLHLRSTPVYDKWFRSLSYDIYAGYVENHHKFGFGLGRSFYLYKEKKIALELMLVDSFQEEKNHLGFQAQIRPHSTGKFRYGVLYNHLYQGFTDEKKLSLSVWMAFDLGVDYGVYLENGYHNQEKGTVKMSMRYYF